MVDDIVGDDHAVVDRAQPARHDDPAASRVIQASNLIGKRSAHGQAFELSSKTRTIKMLGVMLKRDRRGGFSVNDPLATIGHVLFKRVQRCLDQVLLAGFVFFFAHARPIFKIGVGTRNDQRSAFAFGPGVGIVKRERPAGDVTAEQKIGLESLGSAGEQQVAGLARDGIVWVHCHVHLSAGIVEPNRFGIVDEPAVKFVLADQVEDR